VKTIKAISSGLAIIILAILVVQNLEVLSQSEVFRFNFLLASFDSPPLQIYLLLIIFFLLGFAAAYLIGFVKQRRLKKTINKLNQSQVETEKELNSLRNLPLTDTSLAVNKMQPDMQNEN